jgi:capsular exopolysaccharide synthesis family protein
MPVVADTDVLFRPTPSPRPQDTSLAALAERLRGKVMLQPGLPPNVAEQYRHLTARLHHVGQQSGARIVMVASAMPGEGKTLTATNIALTLSESYKRRVLVIDTDLRRPSMHDIFHLPNHSGVNDALLDHTAPPAYEISPRLSVIPAGRPNPDPLSGLTSPRLQALVQAAARAYDWVVIDTPPVGLLTDANLIVRLVDVIVMVVSANKVSYPDLQRAVEALGRDRIIGVVLNRAAPAPFERGGYGYDGYYGGYGPGA